MNWAPNLKLNFAVPICCCDYHYRGMYALNFKIKLIKSCHYSVNFYFFTTKYNN